MGPILAGLANPQMLGFLAQTFMPVAKSNIETLQKNIFSPVTQAIGERMANFISPHNGTTKPVQMSQTSNQGVQW